MASRRTGEAVAACGTRSPTTTAEAEAAQLKPRLHPRVEALRREAAGRTPATNDSEHAVKRRRCVAAAGATIEMSGLPPSPHGLQSPAIAFPVGVGACGSSPAVAIVENDQPPTASRASCISIAELAARVDEWFEFQAEPDEEP